MPKVQIAYEDKDGRMRYETVAGLIQQIEGKEQEAQRMIDAMAMVIETETLTEQAEQILSAAMVGELSERMELREAVRKFAERMEEKLAKNTHKGNRDGWLDETISWLASRLVLEVGELMVAIQECPQNEIARECADVANFAMMIADHCREDED